MVDEVKMNSNSLHRDRSSSVRRFRKSSDGGAMHYGMPVISLLFSKGRPEVSMLKEHRAPFLTKVRIQRAVATTKYIWVIDEECVNKK